MRRITIQVIGLAALAAGLVYGQPTNGPVYWSTTAPDCSSLFEQPVAIKNASGTTLGYSCVVSGTFIWLAAGGPWSTAIRVGAPTSAPIGVDYTFYDTNGNNMSLDVTGSVSASGNDVNFALNTNQPSEIVLQGATNTNHGTTVVGSAYALFYCPDAPTCINVLPQLIYSSLPSQPWLLSVPISWDGSEWTQWSAEGVDDASVHRVSFVVYNADLTAKSYTLSIYDSSGKVVASGTTPSVAPLNSVTGEGGTYGALLSDVVKTPLPSGTFKVFIDGGSLYSDAVALQFIGPAATTLQVAYDGPTTASTTGPSTTGPQVSAASALRPNSRRTRMASTPRQVFPALAR